jgi:pectate lyase
VIHRSVRTAVAVWTALGAALVGTGCGNGTDVFLARVIGDTDAGMDIPDADTDTALAEDGASPEGDASPDAPEDSPIDATSGGACQAFDAASRGPIGSACGPDGQAPIDPDALLCQVVGFASAVTGGRGGCVYHVTSLDDSGPGTLREAAGLTVPAWIVFDVSGDIMLASEIRVASDKTIDGRGAQIVVHNYGLGILGPAGNVVIENLSFMSDLTDNNDDAIRVIMGGHTVWVDHCSFSGYDDGDIDITRAQPSVITDVTVSWCHFTNHPKTGVMLIGRSAGDTDDVNMRVTVHHSWWEQTAEYAPRLRFGMAHSFNNFIDRWITAAAAVTMAGQLYSERNVYVADQNKTAITTSAGGDMIIGNAISVSDRFDNGATADVAVPANVFTPSYPYTADPADDALVANIMAGAGVH